MTNQLSFDKIELRLTYTKMQTLALQNRLQPLIQLLEE